MKYNLALSKILDKHIPADDVGTDREKLRLDLHKDISNLINHLITSEIEIINPKPLYSNRGNIDPFEDINQDNNFYSESNEPF